MNYTHIIPQERVLIEEYKLTGKPLSYIGKQLKRCKSTIKYELDFVSPYNALQTQLDSDIKRERYGCKIVVDLEDISHILHHLKKGWSPEAIAGRYKNEHGKPFPISLSTIYRYSKAELFKLSQKLFIRKGKKPKNNE